MRARRPILELFRQEVRMFLRDRRAVVLSIVLPVIVMPVMIFGGHWMEKRRERELKDVTYQYTVLAQDDALRLIGWNTLNAATKGGDKKAGRSSFRSVPPGKEAERIAEGKLDLYIEVLPAGAREPAKQPPDSKSFEADPELQSTAVAISRHSVPRLLIHYRADRDSSRHAATELRKRLFEYRDANRKKALRDKGFDIEPALFGKLSEQDLATKDQASGLYVGRFLTLFLLFFLFVGGSSVAIDSIAGEKERGTLETLLTTSIRRSEIIGAKMMLVVAVALVITTLQVANMLAYFGFKVIELPKGLVVTMSPGTAVLLLFLYLPLIVLVSGLLLFISGKAKTYKEAQLNFTPLFFLGILPAIAPFFPGLKLRSVLVLIPITNMSLGVKEVLVGNFDWLMLALAWLVNAGAAFLVMKRVTETLSQERLISAADTDLADIQGGPALFPRRVFVWFGLMWVLLLSIAANVESASSLTSQIVLNVVLIFLGGSLFLIWKYRLPVRETLALRPVRFPVWIAVLIGAPSSLVVAHGVFKLANLFLPVPKKMLESFGQQLLPADYPFWSLLLLIAVVPGICEEIAFRGVFLYGVRRKYHRLVLPLVVGLVFGFFHVALFRIIPTAFLGVILTAATLLTGSIFPAMLWHAGNNAVSLVLSRWNVNPNEITAIHFAAAVVGLVISFLILYRFRTPYPGLRKRGDR